MFNKILVPTDGSDFATVGVQYAIALAKQHGSLLHGIHVVDIKLLEGPFLRDISASLGTAPFVNYQSNIALILEERGAGALKHFSKLCGEAGVQCETSQETANVSRCIVEKSELTDLIVMGRAGEHSHLINGLLGSTTETVVRRAHCPVLVTGTADASLAFFVVAYDGSSHANKALHIAADMGEAWKVPFEVLMVSEDDRDTVEKEARSYLDAREVDVDYVRRSGDASETIVSYLEERGANLLVMGAYGHTKMRELVVGSTTAYAINHAPCPVLLTR